MAYCPECEMEYREGFAVCSDCEVPLLTGAPPALSESDAGKDEEWVTIETVGTTEESALIRGFLENSGIPTRTEDHKDDAFSVTLGELAELQIQVPAARQQEAIRVLEDRDAAYDGVETSSPEGSVLTVEGNVADIDVSDPEPVADPEPPTRSE